MTQQEAPRQIDLILQNLQMLPQTVDRIIEQCSTYDPKKSREWLEKIIIGTARSGFPEQPVFTNDNTGESLADLFRAADLLLERGNIDQLPFSEEEQLHLLSLASITAAHHNLIRRIDPKNSIDDFHFGEIIHITDFLHQVLSLRYTNFSLPDILAGFTPHPSDNDNQYIQSLVPRLQRIPQKNQMVWANILSAAKLGYLSSAPEDETLWNWLEIAKQSDVHIPTELQLLLIVHTGIVRAQNILWENFSDLIDPSEDNQQIYIPETPDGVAYNYFEKAQNFTSALIGQRILQEPENDIKLQ